MIRVGVDTGGTFTDVVVSDGETLRVFKLPSTPGDPAAALLAGVSSLADFELLHGTTVATNAILERKLAKTAFITNEGFRDLLFLARQTRPDLYALEPVLPMPPVEREDCFGVPGRLLPDGTELEPLDVSALPDLSGYEAIAVCLLFSYVNPDHEKRVAEALADVPFISVSHEVSPEFREYERAMTTTLNAAVGPIMRGYLQRIKEASSPAKIMSSAGGLISLDDAAAMPVRTITSGPAGGVMASEVLMRLHGRKRGIAFDMGGTSTDVTLINETASFSSVSENSGLPLRMHRVDVHTVGCGGGSIAFLDSAGALRVGPESAGAEPGPALYARGGPLTVTDANVILGRLPLHRFARKELSRGESFRVASSLANDLGRTEAEVAEAVVESAEAQMAAAIRVVSSARGYAPSDFTLISYGGSGGLHACAVAEELEIREVLVPPFPGAFSAMGLLLAPRIWEQSITVLAGNWDWDGVFHELEVKAKKHLLEPDRALRIAELRYQGQSHEIAVAVRGSRRETENEFESAHRERYGFQLQGRAVEWVAARVRLEADSPMAEYSYEQTAPQMFAEGARVVWCGSEITAELLNRESLMPGDRIERASIILADDCTIFVPPGWRGEAQNDRSFVMAR